MRAILGPTDQLGSFPSGVSERDPVGLHRPVYETPGHKEKTPPLGGCLPHFVDDLETCRVEKRNGSRSRTRVRDLTLFPVIRHNGGWLRWDTFRTSDSFFSRKLRWRPWSFNYSLIFSRSFCIRSSHHRRDRPLRFQWQTLTNLNKVGSPRSTTVRWTWCPWTRTSWHRDTVPVTLKYSFVPDSLNPDRRWLLPLTHTSNHTLPT